MPETCTAPLVMTKQQVAEALTVSEDTIENLHRVGQLRGVLIGKHLRWRPADVSAFVEGLGGEGATR